MLTRGDLLRLADDLAARTASRRTLLADERHDLPPLMAARVRWPRCLVQVA